MIRVLLNENADPDQADIMVGIRQMVEEHIEKVCTELAAIKTTRSRMERFCTQVAPTPDNTEEELIFVKCINYRLRFIEDVEKNLIEAMAIHEDVLRILTQYVHNRPPQNMFINWQRDQLSQLQAMANGQLGQRPFG